MIPIALVTGFLGTGKTTFLQRIVETHAERKLAYLVNEFSPVDVDGTRLALPDGMAVTIAGGSIFCRCKVTDFLRELRSLAERKPEGVVIEASGMADPQVVGRMLAETDLGGVFRLSSVVTVVDPGSFPKLLKTLTNVTRQVACADVVLINKTDLHTPEDVKATEDLVRGISQSARVERVVRCQAEVTLFGERAADAAPNAEYAQCVDPNFTRAHVAFSAPIDWPRLRQALDADAACWYRIKGAVPVGSGLLAVDFSASGWSERKADARERPVLVLIGARDTGAQLERMVERINAGEFAA